MNNIMVCSECMSDIPAGSAVCPVCHHSFANTNPPAALPVGTVLAGKYTLGAFMLHDGEGITYNAVDNVAHQLVTIKEFAPANLAKGRAASGFILPADGNEVLYKTTRMDYADMYRALISLAGTKGLQTVYDVREENNTVYAVYEPQQSISLEAYLARRPKPLTQQEAAKLLAPVVHGVAEMHRVGLLHRGISTTTVYVEKDGTAWLGGYATLGLREVGSELECELFEGYTAPEQYRVTDFDGKYTDVYALGALFYRAVSGTQPVDANDRLVADSLTPIKRLVPSLPGYAAAAISGAMRLDTRHRAQTAEAFLAAFMSPTASGNAEMGPDKQKMIMVGAIGVVSLFIIIGIIATMMLAKNLSRNSSSVSEETSSMPMSSSVSAALTMPNFLSKKYADVVADTQYNYLRFTVESAYSDAYREGEIMGQSITAGTEITSGTLVVLTVSLGEELVSMPEVVNHPKDYAAGKLDALGIAYTVVMVENDGTYIAGFVVNCDVEADTKIKADRSVVLYVAKEPATIGTSGSSDSTSADSGADLQNGNKGNGKK